jgi:hypothetical protein
MSNGNAFTRLTARIPGGTKTAIAGGLLGVGALALKSVHDIANNIMAERLMQHSRHVAHFAGRMKDLPYRNVASQPMHAAAQPLQRLKSTMPYHGLKAFAAQPHMRAAPRSHFGGGIEPRDDRGRWTTGGSGLAAGDATITRLLSKA